MPEQYPKGENPEEELLKGVEKLSESARFFSEIEHFALEEGRAENSMVSVYRGEHLVAKALTSPKFGGQLKLSGLRPLLMTRIAYRQQTQVTWNLSLPLKEKAKEVNLRQVSIL